MGVCKLLIRGCFKCGSIDHFIENCPRESGDSRSMQGSGEGDLLHHLRLGIKVGVEVARFSIEDVEV